ncbi:MAG: acyl-CoA dehydrogenase [SAR324 cluster bacterium]|nr:acyl-CoA dehydrogenase [SAR324 cluster bacterium]
MSSTELVIDSQDIQFVMNEWLKLHELSKFPRYADFDQETINLLLEEGFKFAVEVISPTRTESDREGCKMVEGRAKVPPCLHKPYQQAYELGWASIAADPKYGGQGAPRTVQIAINEAVAGANLGLSMYFALTEGALELIDSFGTENLKEQYIEKMVKGEFTGTMCLSEPHAGSDVGAGLTSAERTADGRYKIKGTKSWISSGDNDLGKNVIHALLARIKGAPSGTKGLSLFLVPMFRLNEDGSVGESNDVTLASIEEKMGIHCSATAVLNFGENDDCYGYLLGEEEQGMACMFQMMNGARIGVATTALAVSSAAYQNALSYAKERVQGPHISKIRDAEAARVPIIEHPDVRLNLMRMKSLVEAQRALLYATGKYLDILHAAEDESERKAADDMLQMLTPMCKGWGTEVGLDVVSTGIQILGGVGYTQDFPLEQQYRDIRITPIYEGTTGIQALDLLGRKMTMRNGALFMNLLAQFNAFSQTHKEHPLLGKAIQKWTKSGEKIAGSAMTLQSILGQRGMEGSALYATPFLMHFSAVTAAFFLLEQGIAAAASLAAIKADKKVPEDAYAEFLQGNSEALFYDNKIKTTQFYVNVVLPTFEALTQPIQNQCFEALEITL